MLLGSSHECILNPLSSAYPSTPREPFFDRNSPNEYLGSNSSMMQPNRPSRLELGNERERESGVQKTRKRKSCARQPQASPRQRYRHCLDLYMDAAVVSPSKKNMHAGPWVTSASDTRKQTCSIDCPSSAAILHSLLSKAGAGKVRPGPRISPLASRPWPDQGKCEGKATRKRAYRTALHWRAERPNVMARGLVSRSHQTCQRAIHQPPFLHIGGRESWPG